MMKELKKRILRTALFAIVFAGAWLMGTSVNIQAQGVNVAPGKAARQSSDPFGARAVASVAVDGNTNGNWADDLTNSVTHTAADNPFSWWEVDLGQVYDISSIVLWNRTDCCRERLDGFTILVGETPIQINDRRVFASDAFFGGSDSRSFVSSRNNRGRFVRIALNRNESLSLAEVQVFGTPVNSGGAISGGVSQDDQFWNTVKNSTDPADFEAYLAAFPNGNSAALARFNRDRFKKTQPTSNIDPADQRFWDSIRSSRNISDFQRYLSVFPSGAFRAEAQREIDALSPRTVDPADQRFWDSIKLSRNIRDFQQYLSVFPSGAFRADAQRQIDLLSPRAVDPADQRFWDSIKTSRNIADFQRYLSVFPAGAFRVDAQRQIDALTPRPITPTTSRNASFLNQWARDTNTKLPVMEGNILLVQAVSHCSAGCEQTDSNDSLILEARTPSLNKQNTTIGQLEGTLRPALIAEYCGSPGRANNIPLGVTIDDRNGQRIGNFFLSPSDCGGTSGATVGTNSSAVLPSGRTEAQVMAAAQVGSLSELATARSYLIASDNLDAKTKITKVLQKELPQLQSAVSQSNAEFIIAVSFKDRLTGQDADYDANNPNLQAEFVVFTVTQWVNNSPFNIRTHFRTFKSRNFGVLSDTPEVGGAKEFAKQFSKVIR